MTNSNLMTDPRSAEPQRPDSSTMSMPDLQSASVAAGELSASVTQPVPGSGDISREVSQLEAEVDEIEKYFASLLQRVGGTGKTSSSPASSKSSPTIVIEAISEPAKAAKPVASGDSVSAAPAVIDAQPVEEIAAGPKELPPPRATADFCPVNWQVLRDVANDHRRGALDQHDCQRLRRKAHRLWALALAMAGLTLWLSLASSGLGGMQLFASLTGLVGAIVCSFAYCRLVRRFRLQVNEMDNESRNSRQPRSPEDPSHA
jgi:hypothetical protein